MWAELHTTELSQASLPSHTAAGVVANSTSGSPYACAGQRGRNGSAQRGVEQQGAPAAPVPSSPEPSPAAPSAPMAPPAEGPAVASAPADPRQLDLLNVEAKAARDGSVIAF